MTPGAGLRLYTIDLLRFLAAIAVVFYHYTARPSHNDFPNLAQLTQFGYLGVPLFFMISGFVIFASAEKGSASQFVISRATRLFPAFWVGVTVTALIIYLTERSHTPISQYLANMTMLNDYLGVKNIDGVYWTLQAELKFYFCVFLLLTLGLFSKHKLWLSGWLALTTLYTFTKQPFFFPWLINPNYSAYFISGIAFYLIYKEGGSKYNLMVLITAMALCLYHSHHQASEFITLSKRSDFWVVAGFITAFHLTFLLIALRKWTLAPAATYTMLGGITYPLYLIHNRAGKSLLDTYSTSESYSIMAFAMTVGALLLAYLIYRFIEPPLAKILKASLKKVVAKIIPAPKNALPTQPPTT